MRTQFSHRLRYQRLFADTQVYSKMQFVTAIADWVTGRSSSQPPRPHDPWSNDVIAHRVAGLGPRPTGVPPECLLMGQTRPSAVRTGSTPPHLEAGHYNIDYGCLDGFQEAQGFQTLDAPGP